MGQTQTTEPYPGFNKEAAAHAARARALGEAAAQPLPGPLAGAFGEVPETVAGLRVRPVVHYDFTVLRALNSPLLRQLEGSKKREAFTDDQGYEMVLQFTTPPEDLAGLLDQHGKGFAGMFRGLARKRIGFALGPVEVALLVKGVEKAFLTAFSTVLQFEPKAQDDGGFPKPPAGPGTGSAGGSITSPG